jgi:hypothetical protein
VVSVSHREVVLEMKLMVIPLQATVPMETKARMTATLLEEPLLMETLLMEVPQAMALQATALQATVLQATALQATALQATTPRAAAHKVWAQKETALMMVPVLVLATITTELLVVILVPLLDHLQEMDPALEVTQMMATTLATATATAPGQDQGQAPVLKVMVREMEQVKSLRGHSQDPMMATIPLTGQVTGMAQERRQALDHHLVTVLVTVLVMVLEMAVPGTLVHPAVAHKLHHPRTKPVVYKEVEAQRTKAIPSQTTHYLLVVHQQPLGQQDPRILHHRTQATLTHHRPPS